MKWIYRLDELCKDHNELVGRKCASLGEMTRAGFRVPPGFALTLGAYDNFMKETGAAEQIRQYLATFSADPDNAADMTKYEEASKVIRDIVVSKEMPTGMKELISHYYDELCQMTGIADVSVATRSAGPVSHPGQYETYLCIRGSSAVTDNVIKVWASTFNPRSIIARARLGLPLEYDPIGVAILKMVNARAAGVMFTLNPVTGDASKVLIEGNWGLGESVVSGEVTPDTWMVDKVTLEINRAVVSTKLKEYVLDTKTGRTMFVDIPRERQNLPCLSKEEVLELVRIGKKIEEHYGEPQDTEWAIDNDLPFPENVFMLQCRPEQVWGQRKGESVLGKKSGYELLMERALTSVKVKL
ncbi:PEP/pyruvate-binding domain-containing protein [Dehalococcoidia bacterium]|nr:PEP/pyruvate-binding domain-containing protein [Dehalococcoidia bacterium]